VSSLPPNEAEFELINKFYSVRTLNPHLRTQVLILSISRNLLILCQAILMQPIRQSQAFKWVAAPIVICADIRMAQNLHQIN
jgi:hypothetical protein